MCSQGDAQSEPVVADIGEPEVGKRSEWELDVDLMEYGPLSRAVDTLLPDREDLVVDLEDTVDFVVEQQRMELVLLVQLGGDSQ